MEDYILHPKNLTCREAEEQWRFQWLAEKKVNEMFADQEGPRLLERTKQEGHTCPICAVVTLTVEKNRVGLNDMFCFQCLGYSSEKGQNWNDALAVLSELVGKDQVGSGIWALSDMALVVKKDRVGRTFLFNLCIVLSELVGKGQSWKLDSMCYLCYGPVCGKRQSWKDCCCFLYFFVFCILFFIFYL